MIMYKDKSVFRSFGPKRAEVHPSCVQLKRYLLCQPEFDLWNSPIGSTGEDSFSWAALCLLKTSVFPGAICVSTLPCQETINTTICGLVTSPVIPPTQIMTNGKKKAGWASHWCHRHRGRTSSGERARSNRDTMTGDTVWLLCHNGSF